MGGARPAVGSADAAGGGGAVSSSALADAANAAAVERWEAEKRLQKRLQIARVKLEDKTREWALAEAELAKTRTQLEETARREAALREGLAVVREQLAREQRERESVGFAEMRNRGKMGSELLSTQQELARVKNELARATSVRGSAAIPSKVTADGSEEGIRAQLLEREQQVLEQAFTIEMHELSIAQLEARLGAFTAYQTVLSTEDDVSDERRLPSRVNGGIQRAVRKRPGIPVPAPPKQEDLNAALVERMTRVVKKLQAENAALQKKAVSNLKSTEVNRENKELKTNIERLEKELAEGSKHAAGLREEAVRSMRELELMKNARNVEAERAAALERELAEALERSKSVREPLERQEVPPSKASQAVQADRDLEKQNAHLLEQLNLTRQEALEYCTSLHDARRERDELRDKLLEQRDDLEAKVSLSDPRQPIGSKLDEALQQIQALEQECAHLRHENRELAEELASLTTPEFLEEIDRLRTHYQHAQAQLQRYGQRFGML